NPGRCRPGASPATRSSCDLRQHPEPRTGQPSLIETLPVVFNRSFLWWSAQSRILPVSTPILSLDLTPSEPRCHPQIPFPSFQSLTPHPPICAAGRHTKKVPHYHSLTGKSLTL